MYKSNKRVLNELPACYAILRKLSVFQNLLMSEKCSNYPSQAKKSHKNLHMWDFFCTFALETTNPNKGICKNISYFW